MGLGLGSGLIRNHVSQTVSACVCVRARVAAVLYHESMIQKAVRVRQTCNPIHLRQVINRRSAKVSGQNRHRIFSPCALDVQPRALAASIISAKLGAPRLYTNRSVIVVGVGPSGLESAVRICNYGAAHVALLARGTSASNSRSSTTRGLRYVRGVASRLVRARQSRTHDCPPP